MINAFDFEQPGTVDEALAILGDGGARRIVPIAGGTNLMVQLKYRPLDADLVVDLSHLASLRNIAESNGILELGAGVTFAQLLAWRPGGAVQGLLRPMARAFAGPLIRNLATMGGNLCDASPAADVSPPLLALGARVRLASAARGERALALPDFFRGVRQTARRPDELLTTIEIPRPAADADFFYYKLGKRKADAISIVSVALLMRKTKDRVEEIRIALGAVAPVAMRAERAEALLHGERLVESSIAAAARKAAEESRPIDDFRAGAAYRREMVETLVRRGLERMASRAGG